MFLTTCAAKLGSSCEAEMNTRLPFPYPGAPGASSFLIRVQYHISQLPETLDVFPAERLLPWNE